MGLAVSIVVVALGALLTWAVDARAGVIGLGTVGPVLLVLGGTGMVLALLAPSRATGEREPEREARSAARR